MRRLLEIDRVLETINVVTDYKGNSDLHHACEGSNYIDLFEKRPQTVDLLLQAGADSMIKNNGGKIALDILQDNDPTDYATAALLEDYGRIHQLSKARRQIEDYNFLAKEATDAEARNHDTRVTCFAKAPAYLKKRVAAGEPLPQVRLTSPIEGERLQVVRRATLAYVLETRDMEGIGGMPPDVFQELMLMMMPRPR